MKPRTLSFLLAVIMSMVASVASAEDFSVDDIYYSITSSTEPYTVAVTYRGSKYSSYSDEYTGSVTIPESVTCSGKTYSVTSINQSAFYGCTGLTSVEIPNSVTSIGNYAFYGCTGLTSVEIPNSVTSINQSAFYGCTGLTSVTIGNSVTEIGFRAFYGCSGLTSVEISNSVTEIGNYAFSDCSGLTSVEIPNSVTSIGGGAFYGCSGLTSVVIGNSVTSIGEWAFYNCSGLTSVEIPNSVTSIGDEAFRYCTGLTSIVVENGNTMYDSRDNCNAVIETSSNTLIAGCKNTAIPNSVTSIGYRAFRDCSGLTSVEIPNSVTEIGNAAFLGCTGLTSITIGNSVTSIGSYAFSDCSGLTSVTIPESVTSIGESAFSGCSGLTSVVFNAKKCTSCGSSQYPAFPSTITELTIGNEVETIPNDAFRKNHFIKAIWLSNTPPSGYTYVNGEVNYVPNDQYTRLSNMTVYPYLSTLFEVDGIKYVPVSPSERTCDAIDCCYNSSAEHINIGKTVSYRGVSMTVKNVQPYVCYGNRYIRDAAIDYGGDIPANAFCNCSGLTSVTIGNSVTSISDCAFLNCTGLTSVEIPNSVTSIGSGAFYDTAWYNAQPDGLVYAGKVAYEYKGTMPENTEIVLAEGTLGIAGSAFRGCSGLTSIEIPNSVTSIGGSAFSGCTGLTSVTIPNSVTSIGYAAFQNCKGLTSVEIPNSVTSIGYQAFYGCSGLTSVEIPNSVTSIGDCAFYLCSGLTSIEIPNSVTSIGGGAFYNTAWYNAQPDGLVYAGKVAYEYKGTMQEGTEIVLEEGTLSITASAFYGCSGLTSVTIPNSVTEIGYQAFYGCSGLTSVTIGNSVTSIGYQAFYGCTEISQLFIKADTPPSLPGSAFSEQTFVQSTLYVPIGKKDTYAYSNIWNQFNTIKEADTANARAISEYAYTLMEVGTFSYVVYNPVNDCLEMVSSSNVDENNPNHCWQTVEVSGKKFLYNIGAKKFAVPSTDGSIFRLSSEVGSIAMEDGDKGIVIGGNTAQQWALVVDEKIDAYLGLEDVVATGVLPIDNGQLTMDNAKGVYDLSGRRMNVNDRSATTGDACLSKNVNVNNSKFEIQNSKLRKGIYIMNGKRVLIK